MSEQRIASRYSKALFDKAQELGILDVVKENVDELISLAENSRDFLLFIQSPMYKMAAKKKALSTIFAQQHALTQSLYALMVDKKREAFIPMMGERFIKMYNKEQQIVLVEVESAVPLSPDTLKEIDLYVKKETGAKTVSISTRIDTAIIGGITIEFNGRIFDNTVLTQLKKIKKELQIA
jgi:F-type H+-transporting ATPase subunit delta